MEGEGGSLFKAVRAGSGRARVVSAIGAVLLVGWVVLLAFLLLTETMACASDGSAPRSLFGFAMPDSRYGDPIGTYGLQGLVVSVWAVLLTVVGLGSLALASAGSLRHSLDPGSRRMLISSGLLMSMGPLLVSLILAWLVQSTVVTRSLGGCA